MGRLPQVAPLTLTMKRTFEMPTEFKELMTAGILAPEPNGMTCANCNAPVLLVWEKPIGIEWDKLIPGGMWGDDVSVICLRCSFQSYK